MRSAKAPIGPQIVQSRFKFQRGQRPVTLTEGVVQPFESHVVASQAGVQNGYIEERHIFVH